MSFKEPNDPRSSKIGNSQIQLTELVTYEERSPGGKFEKFVLEAKPLKPAERTGTPGLHVNDDLVNLRTQTQTKGCFPPEDSSRNITHPQTRAHLSVHQHWFSTSPGTRALDLGGLDDSREEGTAVKLVLRLTFIRHSVS